MNKEIEIPEGYEARIEGNKVILERKEWESENERMRKELLAYAKLHRADFKEYKYSKNENERQNFLWWRNIIDYLERQQERLKMIQWTGENLKEVIDFTGKYPRFDEWFKSWEEYENYVHSHSNIFKLFCLCFERKIPV